MLGILTHLEELLATSKSEALIQIFGVRNPCCNEMLTGISNNDMICLLEILPDREQLAAVSTCETLIIQKMLSSHDMLTAKSTIDFFCLPETLTDHEHLAEISNNVKARCKPTNHERLAAMWCPTAEPR